MAETNPVADNSERTMTGSGLHSKSVVQSLLTLERAQKLDLLNHLITNLQQSLVVCGPEGIGKTTLLENLMAGKPDFWIVFSINATARFSFEQAQAGLLQHLQQSDHAFVRQDIDQILTVAEENNQKIVFIIDDAGLLVPGLINSLCQFASAYPVLRVVFALTADEVHLKTSSDRAVDECHFIEIPALSESQCGEFLKNLASKPGAIIPAENLNSAMISRLYRETHGIPGKIVNIQRYQNTGSLSKNWQWISLAAAIFLTVIVSFFLWDEEPDKLQQQIEQNLSRRQAENIVEKVEPSPPIIEDIETKLPIDPDVVSVDIEPPVVEKSEDIGGTFSESIDVAKNEIKDAGADPLELEKQTASEPGNVELKTDSTAVIDNAVINSSSDEVKPAQGNQKTLVKKSQNEAAEKAPTIDQGQAVMISPEATSDNKKIKTDPTTAAMINDNSDISIPAEEQKPSRENREPLVKPAQIETTETTPSKVVKQKVEQSVGQKSTEQVNNKSQAKSKSLQGKKWVLDQKANYYSLQLMAISKQRKAALLKIINKHSQLQDKLHYFETIKKGEEKYILLYGSFSTSAEAEQAINKLPKEFGKPWLRSFKVLHKQVKANRG